MRAKDLRIPLVKCFQLTEEELNAWHSSGNTEIFLGRISWALSSLFITGLAERPEKGTYKISPKGMSMLASYTDEQINTFIKEAEKARNAKREVKSKNAISVSSPAEEGDERTPEEELADYSLRLWLLY